MEQPKPLVTVDLDRAGKPIGAEATAVIAASRARVWQFIANVDGYANIVPMLHKVKRNGDSVTVQLRFKLSLFSVGFEFTCAVQMQEPAWLELNWTAGEPQALRIRFDLDEDGPDRTKVRAGIWFDPFSLGWLTKVFLKHHPEIQYGIFPGCALAIVDSMRKVAESR